MPMNLLNDSFQKTFKNLEVRALSAPKHSAIALSFISDKSLCLFLNIIYVCTYIHTYIYIYIYIYIYVYQWYIFHIITSEDIDDVIFFTSFYIESISKNENCTVAWIEDMNNKVRLLLLRVSLLWTIFTQYIYRERERDDITRWRKDMDLIFELWKQYFKNERCELVKYFHYKIW